MVIVAFHTAGGEAGFFEDGLEVVGRVGIGTHVEAHEGGLRDEGVESIE